MEVRQGILAKSVSSCFVVLGNISSLSRLFSIGENVSLDDRTDHGRRSRGDCERPMSNQEAICE